MKYKDVIKIIEATLKVEQELIKWAKEKENERVSEKRMELGTSTRKLCTHDSTIKIH